MNINLSIAKGAVPKTDAIDTVPDVVRAAGILVTCTEPDVVAPVICTEPDTVPDGVSANGLLHKLSVKSALLVTVKPELGPAAGSYRKAFEPVQEITQLAEMEHSIFELSVQEAPVNEEHKLLKVGILNVPLVSVPAMEVQTPAGSAAEVTPIRVKTRNNLSIIFEV